MTQWQPQVQRQVPKQAVQRQQRALVLRALVLRARAASGQLVQLG